MENFNGVNFLLQVMVWKTNFDTDYGDVVKPQKYGSSVDGTHGTGVSEQPVEFWKGEFLFSTLCAALECGTRVIEL